MEKMIYIGLLVAWLGFFLSLYSIFKPKGKQYWIPILFSFICFVCSIAIIN